MLTTEHDNYWDMVERYGEHFGSIGNDYTREEITEEMILAWVDGENYLDSLAKSVFDEFVSDVCDFYFRNYVNFTTITER